MVVSACLAILALHSSRWMSTFLTTRRELGRDAAVAEPHGTAVGGLGLGLPQRRELGRNAAVAEPHGAGVGSLGLGLPQWRELGPGLGARRLFVGIHIVPPRFHVGHHRPA